jgi:hypothetical protein
MEVNSMEENELSIDPTQNMPINELAQTPVIIIEEITRGQKLIHRHKLTKETITIGRGYDNDIILSDPHICPNHAQLDFSQGSWKVNDQKSINGSFLENPNSKKRNADQHTVHDGDIISIGKSQLRILFIDHPISPTIQLSSFENLINVLRHPVALFISMALFIAVVGALSYLSSPLESNYSQFFVAAIGMALLFSLWPGGVALVSHLTKHDARIMAQLGISFAVFNCMWLTDFLQTIVTFNTASNSLLLMLTNILPIALAFSLFWLNCHIGFHMTAKRRIIVAFSITTLLFGGGYLVQYSHKPEFNPHPQYNATILAPSFLLTSSSNVDMFIEDSSKLFEKVKEEAKEDKK